MTPTPTNGPTPEDEVQKGFDSVQVLGRIDKLEDGSSRLHRLVGDVRDTNTLINIVLFVGFLALLLSFLAPIVGRIINGSNDSDNSATIRELQKIEDKQDSLQQQINVIQAQRSATNTSQ